MTEVPACNAGAETASEARCRPQTPEAHMLRLSSVGTSVVVDEAFWKQGPPVVQALEVMTQGPPRQKGLRSEGWVAADGTFLYVAVRSQVEGKSPRSTVSDGQVPGLYDDRVEIVVSPSGTRDSDYRFIKGARAGLFRLNDSTGASSIPRAKAASQWEKGWWDLKVAIPWDDLGGLPGAEPEICIQIYRR